jgi:hypothetical protein
MSDIFSRHDIRMCNNYLFKTAANLFKPGTLIQVPAYSYRKEFSMKEFKVTPNIVLR